MPGIASHRQHLDRQLARSPLDASQKLWRRECIRREEEADSETGQLRWMARSLHMELQEQSSLRVLGHTFCRW